LRGSGVCFAGVFEGVADGFVAVAVAEALAGAAAASGELPGELLGAVVGVDDPAAADVAALWAPPAPIPPATAVAAKATAVTPSVPAAICVIRRRRRSRKPSFVASPTRVPSGGAGSSPSSVKSRARKSSSDMDPPDFVEAAQSHWAAVSSQDGR